jgi:hypothetical protein
MITLLAMAACTGDDPTSDGPADATDPTDTDTTRDTDDPTPSTTGGTGDTSQTPTGDTGVPPGVFDCATISGGPLTITQMTGVRGYHDVAFSPTGMGIGIATGFDPDLVQADYYGSVSLLVPGIGTIEQMEWLPDGDLAVASVTRGILRVNAAGGTSVINSNIRPYGLILGPDDMLYAADEWQVYRVDPVTGDSTLLVPAGALAQGSPRVIAFNLDYTKLYMGTQSGSNGRIYVVDLDKNYTPITPPTVHASGVGAGSYHDTMGVDICGYLYVSDYSTSAMYRISPTGQVQTLFDSPSVTHHAHGMEWGTGAYGWNDHAIYVTQPYNQNQVAEVLVGVPSRHWSGTAINLP